MLLVGTTEIFGYKGSCHAAVRKYETAAVQNEIALHRIKTMQTFPLLQIAHRLRKSRGLFSVTRKFLAQAAGGLSGGSTTTSSSATSLASVDGIITASASGFDGSSLSASQSDSQLGAAPIAAACQPAFPDDAPELQMRRLADLSFLFQQYESAHQIYDLLRRDFKEKRVWLHYAGVQVIMQQNNYKLFGSSS